MAALKLKLPPRCPVHRVRLWRYRGETYCPDCTRYMPARGVESASTPKNSVASGRGVS